MRIKFLRLLFKLLKVNEVDFMCLIAGEEMDKSCKCQTTKLDCGLNWVEYCNKCR